MKHQQRGSFEFRFWLPPIWRAAQARIKQGAKHGIKHVAKNGMKAAHQGSVALGVSYDRYLLVWALDPFRINKGHYNS